MKKVVLSVVAALAFSAAPALAADMPTKAKVVAPAAAPSPWDIAFGTAFTTDYELRGVSQSAHKPSVNGYFEVDFTATDWVKFYAGIHGYSLYTGFADAEFDISGGARFSWGNFGLDLGYVYYAYPDGNSNGFGSFGEFYAIPTYKVADWLTIGGVIDGGSNFNNKCLGAGCVGVWVGNADAAYYSVNAVITLPWKPHPDVTLSINPEVGRQWYGSGPNFNLGVASYTYWDVGLDIVYKAVTLDLRYWDTNTSGSFTPAGALVGNGICAVNGHAGMDACSPKFVATLKFDTSLSALK